MTRYHPLPTLFLALATPLIAMLLLAAGPARANEAASGVPAADDHSVIIPAWFSETFLDLPEDVAEAAATDRKLMVYFGQDGCPYCKALMEQNFSQKDIADYARAHFVALALNIWGDRELTALDGRQMSEKDFAADHKVQFTPTLFFYDGKGQLVARLNGYFPPHRFRAVLQYVAEDSYRTVTLGDYLKEHASGNGARTSLADEPFFMKPPFDLNKARQPLAVIFETPRCEPCDEMHDEGFRDAEVKTQLPKFTIARLALGADTPVTTPSGEQTTAATWARALGVQYTPSIVFFDGGREVFRVEAYLRPFHLATAFDYVSSGAYKTQPSFQRFIQEKADAMRERGLEVKIW